MDGTLEKNEKLTMSFLKQKNKKKRKFFYELFIALHFQTISTKDHTLMKTMIFESLNLVLRRVKLNFEIFRPFE